MISVRNFILFFLLICFSKIKAQNNGVNEFLVGGGAHYGYIMAHHKSMHYLINSHVKGFEATYIRPGNGTKIWQQVHGFPDMGFSFVFLDLGNPKQLGQGISLYPFIDLPLNLNSTLKLRLAFTIGYLTQKFDRIENHKNNVIGSKLNGNVNIRFSYQTHISDKLRMDAGIGLTHFSNGAFSTPNLGINIPTMSLLFFYHQDRTKEKIKSDTIHNNFRRTDFVTYLVGGLCEISPAGGRKYAIANFIFALEHITNRKTKWATGLELFNNTSNIEKLKRDSIILKSNIENLQLGYKISYSYRVEQLSFPVEMGVYLFSKYKDDGLFYHRIGMRYDLNKHWIANVTLKTHWAKAELFEFGFGYKL